MSIQPITNEEEHARALDLVDGLIGAEDGSPESHKLDALLTLIDAFEQKTWPLDEAFDPVGLLRQAMTPEVGHTRAELVKLLGSASRTSEILAKKRALTLDMIRAVSEAWGIPVALLTPRYELTTTVAARKPRGQRERSAA